MKRKPPSAYPKGSAIQRAVRHSRRYAAQRRKNEAAKDKKAKRKVGGTIKIPAHTRSNGVKVKAHTRHVKKSRSGKGSYKNYQKVKMPNGSMGWRRKKTAPRKYTY